MRERIHSVLLLGLLFISVNILAQTEGEKLFKQICAACHTINQGKLIGPDLANVQNRRSEDWLNNFIRSSQSMVKKGEPTAVQLFNEYNQIVMPDNSLSEDQIKAVLDYISTQSSQEPSPGETVVPARPLSEATEENIRSGEKLFTGQTRFANKGPSCISCHNVQDAKVMAGGTLARDLTHTFSRLNDDGVRAILNNPPFPAMKQAYKNKPLSDDEIFNLTVFLQQMDKSSESAQKKNYTLNLIFSGIAGAFCLLIIFGGLWIRTKRNSVNKKIYERQIKSV